MVGVAGRSKACATCKSRHIRCDERRPTCYRCEKAGYTCQGYERPLIFIDAVPKKVLTKSGSSRNLGFGYQIFDVTVPTNINTVSLSQRQGASAQKPDNLIHQLLLAQGIRVNADFWQAIGREHSLLHISTEAAALLLQGRVAHHAGAVQQATKMSSMALQQLRSMLAQHHTPQDPVNIPLLVIIMNMTVFELIAATTKDSWKHHVRGLAALIESLGPTVFREPSMRLIFMQARAHIMVLHLEGQCRTFLEEPHWQEVPWAGDPESKSITALYMDIICCIPGLLEDQNRLLEIQQNSATADADAYGPQGNELRSSMRIKVLSLYNKLLDTRWKWELEHPGCCHTLPIRGRTGPARDQHCEIPLPMSSETGTPIYDSVLYFNDLYRAVEMNYHHTCLLILHHLARSLNMMHEIKQLQVASPDNDLNQTASEAGVSRDEGKIPSCNTARRFSFKTNMPLQFPHEMQTDHYAVHNICRTVECLLHPKYGHAGALFLIFPLRVAQVYSDRLPLYIGETYHDGARFCDDLNAYNETLPGAAGVSNDEQLNLSNMVETLEKRESLSTWMRKVMRHIGGVYGLHIANGYT
ncbi:hypothetical protein BJ166DRAFT_60037 [Pestalotiopsis sp. NC0098]|nr:hypothetical protein BJ166DRAFT_60037 [Pestalotiopsis sp. NC0098]